MVRKGTISNEGGRKEAEHLCYLGVACVSYIEKIARRIFSI